MFDRDRPRKPYLLGADFNVVILTNLLVAYLVPNSVKLEFSIPLPLSNI